ncbi:7-deoxyloganetic acid glucosyl transferase [Ziziphus jujuba]|uniref:Glycosyltransferase n=1 Tax=Ziziphus jujuba TaxID=326968 RepID=A0A6P6GL08_ZIZJJ|nr:7-deoxyloganetic acid glucosyl transferase [Ziziphus jujuba]
MEQQQPPHVVLHSIPAHGHIRPLLFLAQLLSQAGFCITFVFTHHFRKSFENLTALSTQFPNLHFEFISDGLPDDHPRSLTFDFFFDIKTKTKPHLKELILLLNAKLPPVTCIISDQYILYPVEVAEELGIPSFTFSSHSASCTLTYFIVPKLIEDGHLPFADDDMNHEIIGVPGVEGILRRRNLPAFCVLPDVHHPAFQFLLNEFTGMTRYSSGLIINTFDELEDQCLPQLATHFGKVYSVGPLHAILNSKIEKYGSQLMGSHISSWKADQNCLAWLDSQPLKSVLYVSFGSLINVSVSQLLEFWHGLVNSGHPFLWVIRPDVILSEAEHGIPEELKIGAKEKGYIVDWAPQEEVLSHQAVGGFFTHCGWNSISESIMARIPMMCWPLMYDQLINSDLITKVLRIGVELEACDRSTIETTIKTLMETRREEFQNSVNRMAKSAEDGIGQGGSSNLNIEILVQHIKKMKQN